MIHRLPCYITLAVGLLAAAVVACAGQPVETVHANRLPAVPIGSRLIVTHCYAASLNPETRFADWCAFVVRPSGFDSGNALERNWQSPHPDETLESADYAGSEFQRGHLCPLASFKADRFAYEVNLTDVVIPQRGDLNAGPWLRIEERVRALALLQGPVECITGPAFLQSERPLPEADEPHRVPSHVWITFLAAGQRESYLLPQTAGRHDAPAKYRIALDVLANRVPALHPLLDP